MLYPQDSFSGRNAISAPRLAIKIPGRSSESSGDANRPRPSLFVMVGGPPLYNDSSTPLSTVPSFSDVAQPVTSVISENAVNAICVDCIHLLSMSLDSPFGATLASITAMMLPSPSVNAGLRSIGVSTMSSGFKGIRIDFDRTSSPGGVGGCFSSSLTALLNAPNGPQSSGVTL